MGNRKLKTRLFVEQAGKCFYCSRECVPSDWVKIGEKEPDNLFTLDHMHPKSLGGSTSYGNSVGSCLKCNREKRTKSVRKFIHKNSTDGKSVDPDLLLYPDNEWKVLIRRIKTEIKGVLSTFPH